MAMRLEPIRMDREIHAGSGAQGAFVLGDTLGMLDALVERYANQVKLVYLDPPFLTGERFCMRVRVGEDDWRAGRGSLQLETFADRQDRETFLAMMRRVLEAVHRMLRADGMLFLHIDYRTHPYLRIMLDEIFGENNFLNEIIWVYQSGGRSLKYFSRKHDVILFYRKSAQYDFNVEDVMVVPSQPRSNHMRRHVDPDGRVYRSIRSNGRVYTYYDDDPVAPSDVWSDVNHLQQKDPERTGYDTQKPLALLNRIVRCASREGELVMDLFAGSSTTLEAARINGRNFVGVDRCPMTLNIARRRLAGSAYSLTFPAFGGEPVCEADVEPGVGFYHVTLRSFELPPEMLPEGVSGMDAVDNWSVGYLRDGGYHAMAEFARSRREPKLRLSLDAPVYAGNLALCVSDVTGRCFCYRIVHTSFNPS